jgi:hypothetical protein
MESIATQTSTGNPVGAYIHTLNPLVKLILIFVIAIVIFLLIRWAYNSYKKNAAQQLKDNSVKTGTSDVSGQPLTADLGTAATTIYNAFYQNDWFGFTEDRPKAMTALENVPNSLIGDLSQVYFQLYGKNLKEDFSKYLSADQWNQVSPKFT